MKCTHPIKVKGLTVPCGQCTACRLNYSAMWALRCVLESQCHQENVFLTLTYNDEHLPKNKSVSKREMQNFLKRFRKSVSPAKVRYYLSGEYGSQYSRPHYHLLVFGIGVKNPVFEKLHWDCKFQGFWCQCKAWKDEKGESIGNCFIGSVTIASAQYVAKYVMKKRKGTDSKVYYQSLGVDPEFCLLSRRPGLGMSYFDRQQKQIYKLGYIMVNGKKFPLPRYYSTKLKERVPEYDFVCEMESYDKAMKLNQEWIKLHDKLGYNAYQYLDDQLEQMANNIQKRMELSKGVLNA